MPDKTSLGTRMKESYENRTKWEAVETPIFSQDREVILNLI